MQHRHITIWVGVIDVRSKFRRIIISEIYCIRMQLYLLLSALAYGYKLNCMACYLLSNTVNAQFSALGAFSRGLLIS